jgi:hypothetical protein
MKFSLITLLFIIGINLNLVGQNFIHFPTDSVAWKVYYEYADLSMQCNNQSIFYQGIFGDTLINGKKWKKINTTLIDSKFTGSCNDYGMESFYLYEDTVGKKIYIKSNQFLNFGNDSLLFDYNWNIGDTIKGVLVDHPFIQVNPITIDSISQKNINNVNRRIWYYTSAKNEFFIEGFGGSTFFYQIDLGRTLTCIKDSNSVFFVNNDLKGNSNNFYPIGKSDSLCTSNSLYFINSINEHESSQYKVYPSIFSDYVIVDGLKTDDKLTISNIIGEIIFTTNDSRIDTKYLPSGTYILTINNYFSFKLIKL